MFFSSFCFFRLSTYVFDLSAEDSSLESCYLRGMEAVIRHDWIALDKEIRLTEKKKEQKKAAEIWLNLTFSNSMISMEDWMKQLKQVAKIHGPMHLYHILGGSATFLCGLRDLSELFVGGKKAERKKAEVWKSSLGKEEWNAYQLARIEFYLETCQKDKIPGSFVGASLYISSNFLSLSCSDIVLSSLLCSSHSHSMSNIFI